MDPSPGSRGVAAGPGPGRICLRKYSRILRAFALRRRSGVRGAFGRERRSMEREIPMNLLLALLLCAQDPAPPDKTQKPPKADPQKVEQEVEVTSSRLEVPLKETPVATTVVDQERIESEHVESLTE